jgi:hypothetical protein
MTFCKRLIHLSFLFLILSSLMGQEQEIDNFYPCEEGSLNEYGLVTFFEDQLRERAIPYQIITYNNRAERHSFSRSLQVDFNPMKENRLYLAFSLNGNSPLSSLNGKIFYRLIEVFTTNAPTTGVTLLFLGGERNTPPVGSLDFLQDFTREETSTLIYLDIKGSDLYLESSIEDYNAPYWLVKEFSHSLKAAFIYFTRDDMRNILSRTGLSMNQTLLSPWLERGIPSLLLTSKEEGKQGLDYERVIENVVKSMVDFTERFDSLEKDNQETNYLPFSLGFSHYSMGELKSLQCIIVFISLFVLIIVFQSRNFRLNLKKNRRNSWALVLIFSLVFIFLYLSSLIIEEIIFIKNIDDLWLRIPRDILYFKLLLALLFSSFFLFIVRGLPLPRTPHFYSYGAFLFALVNMIILLQKDITLIYYSLWLYLCLFLFLLNRKIMIKTLITIIMPVPILIILTTIVIKSYPELSRLILLDRIEGNMIITTFLMPQILLLTSLHFSRYYYHKERRSYTAWAVFVLVPAFLIFITLRIVLLDPFSGQDKQLVNIRDQMDYSRNTRTIYLSSPNPLGNINLTYNNKSLNLNNLGNELTIQEQLDTSYLSYSGELNTFLDRKRLQLTIEPRGNPNSLEILLYTTEGNITVYDCNFPYFPSSDNKQVPIGIGKNPVFPLNIDLTLTADSKPIMQIVIIYDTPPLAEPVIGNKPVELNHTMTITQELDLSFSQKSYSFPSTRK